MLNSTIVRVVDFCARHCWMVVLTGLALAVTTPAYDVSHFSITTDIEALISQTLPWHQRQLALAKDFAQRGIIAVVTASTPENAEQATSALAADLARQPDLFPSVGQPDSGDFFKRNGLLFQSLPEVKQSVRGLIQGKPLIGQL